MQDITESDGDGRMAAPVDQIITQSQLDRIIRRESRVDAAGSLAARIDRYVGNPALSADIAHRYASDMAMGLWDKYETSRDQARRTRRLEDEADAAERALADDTGRLDRLEADLDARRTVTMAAIRRLECELEGISSQAGLLKSERARLDERRRHVDEARARADEARRRFDHDWPNGPVTPTRRWFSTSLRRYLHIERWAQHMGFPATYWRAGARYQKALGEYRARVDPNPPLDVRRRIWDDAQLDWAAAHPSGNRYARLSDGRSSAPGAHDAPDPSRDGLALYESYLHDFHERIRTMGGRSGLIDEQRTRQAATHADASAGQVDPDILAANGVTVDQLRAFTPANLLDLGVDPASVADVIRRMEGRAPDPRRSGLRTLGIRLPVGVAARLAGRARSLGVDAGTLARMMLERELAACSTR